MEDKKITVSGYKKFLALNCRICNSDKLYPFLSLGTMPIPNGFLTKDQLTEPETYYPLGVQVCQVCWLVQLTHIIPAEIMFKNYLYIPSTSTTMRLHFKAMSEDIISDYALKPNDLVVDIGSNDGTLLGYFKEREMKVIGVDPASNLAQLARMKGIEVIDDFFSIKVAEKISGAYGKASVITATNVIAHINDLHGLCAGVNVLLDKEGVFVMEFPYLVDLLDKNEFDTIYHEHLSYFAIKPVQYLLNKYNLRIHNIKRLSIHGGSLRIFVVRNNSVKKTSDSLKELLQFESLKKLDKKSTYDDFTRRVKNIKRELVGYLNSLKKNGKNIVAYGASAKGNVLLNYCKISTDTIDYMVDSIPYKQGKFTPGIHIPIYPEFKLDKEIPDYVLLTAWNFADEILQKKIEYRLKGGQFIITIPYLRIE